MSISPHLPAGERVYAIGDIHGRADLLGELLDRICADNKRRSARTVWIVLVGDLIDRGPDAAKVVAQCAALAARHNRFIVLKGNHEALMVDAVSGSFPALAFWLRHGGDATLVSWGVSSELVQSEPSRELMAAARALIPDEAVAWADRLPLTFQRGNWLFVHAGIRPGMPLSAQVAEDLLWIRGDFIDSAVPHPNFVVHGHTIDEAIPALRGRRLGIDTGAFKTGRLTAVGIEDNDYWILSTGADDATSDDGVAPNPIEESVADILAFEPPAPSLHARYVTKRTTAIASAVLGAVLLSVAAGTLVDRRGSGSTPITAVASGRAPGRAASHFNPSVRDPIAPLERAGFPAEREAQAIGPNALARMQSVEQSIDQLRRAQSFRRSPTPSRPSGRTTYREIASAPLATPSLPTISVPSAPPVATDPRPVPLPLNTASPAVIQPEKVAARTGTAKDVVAAAAPAPKPTPITMSGTEQKRIEAIDAIRSLRRQ